MRRKLHFFIPGVMGLRDTLHFNGTFAKKITSFCPGISFCLIIHAGLGNLRGV